MSAIKAMKPIQPKLQSAAKTKSGWPTPLGVDPKHFQKRATVEAERRTAFVRGMGGALVGYCDGYADGFEQAIQWLFGNLPNPLTADYRPGAGMSFSKEYYESRPKERKSILEWFEKITVKVKDP